MNASPGGAQSKGKIGNGSKGREDTSIPGYFVPTFIMLPEGRDRVRGVGKGGGGGEINISIYLNKMTIFF